MNVGETISDYIALTKPGIMTLLVLEALTAMIVAAGRNVTLASLFWIAVAGILSSGGSSALNHYLERNKDILMSRTDSRPVATHKIPPKNALVFGIVFVALGLVVSQIEFNTVTTLMIFLGAASYIFIYTLVLKPRTHWNIVIGGIAGMFPALAGWAAITNSVGWPAIFIGLLVFLWTPPHFWGLSMRYKEDYERSGYPMLSVVKSEKEVVKAIVWSSVPLLPFSLLPLLIRAFGTFDVFYYSLVTLMGLAFIYVDVKMLRNPTADNGFKAFLISLPYLFVVFGAMIVSSVI